jgi:hypothetical protein
MFVPSLIRKTVDIGNGLSLINFWMVMQCVHEILDIGDELSLY